jgi:hypothetical protein
MNRSVDEKKKQKKNKQKIKIDFFHNIEKIGKRR